MPLSFRIWPERPQARILFCDQNKEIPKIVSQNHWTELGKIEEYFALGEEVGLSADPSPNVLPR